MSWGNSQKGLSMPLFQFSHLNHLHIPVTLLLILPLFHPTLTKPSVIPLTYPLPPVSSPTAAYFTSSTNSSTFIDNLRSLRSVLMICWRDTIISMRKNISANSTDKSFKSWNNDSIEELKDCLMTRALMVFDKVANKDVIEVVPGWMKLVRYKRDDVEDTFSGAWRKSKSSESDERQIFDWRQTLLRRLLRLLRNHHLEINLNPHRNHDMEGRRRHHFMPMLVFGAITSSIIAIPMMFQFLSVLGGKALLLAKLALILTAIQGLKKVATSNFNYGLYNTPGYNNNPYQQYDRKYYSDMNMDYTPPAAGLANPYAEHLDRLNSVNGGNGGSGLGIIPDYQQVLRPRNSVVANVEE